MPYHHSILRILSDIVILRMWMIWVFLQNIKAISSHISVLHQHDYNVLQLFTTLKGFYIDVYIRQGFIHLINIVLVFHSGKLVEITLHRIG